MKPNTDLYAIELKQQYKIVQNTAVSSHWKASNNDSRCDDDLHPWRHIKTLYTAI